MRPLREAFVAVAEAWRHFVALARNSLRGPFRRPRRLCGPSGGRSHATEALRSLRGPFTCHGGSASGTPITPPRAAARTAHHVSLGLVMRLRSLWGPFTCHGGSASGTPITPPRAAARTAHHVSLGLVMRLRTLWGPFTCHGGSAVPLGAVHMPRRLCLRHSNNSSKSCGPDCSPCVAWPSNAIADPLGAVHMPRRLCLRHSNNLCVSLSSDCAVVLKAALSARIGDGRIRTM